MYQWTSFASLLLAVFVASPGYAATLYAVGPWDLTDESNLYSIDTTTGGASFIGSTGVPSLGGIALAADGTLYAYDLFNFYTLDPTLGTATLVGPLGLRAPEGALDFQPGTGTLYGVNASTSGDELLTIDLGTGAASVVGNLGPQGRDPSGLAFRSDGTLFGVAFKNNTQADDQLITIDPATAAVTVIGLLGTSVLRPRWADSPSTQTTTSSTATDSACMAWTSQPAPER